MKYLKTPALKTCNIYNTRAIQYKWIDTLCILQLRKHHEYLWKLWPSENQGELSITLRWNASNPEEKIFFCIKGSSSTDKYVFFLNLRGFGSIFYLAMLLQAGLGRLMIPYIHNVEYIKDIFNTEPVVNVKEMWRTF